MNKRKCEWAGDDPLMVEYHDKEWGKVIRDDKKLFELLNLEGMQAGLSWATILKKRGNYRKACAGFDPVKMARFSAAKMESMLKDPGIIRNRLKVKALVHNARAYLNVQKEMSFSKYIWSFVEGKQVVNSWKSMKEIPVNTPEAVAMSKDLKMKGFNFVGPTICYAFMQSCGMVNDHLTYCFRYKEV